jgi:hypothetical protein
MSRRLVEVLNRVCVLRQCNGCKRADMRPEENGPPDGWTTTWKQTKRGMQRDDRCPACHDSVECLIGGLR